MAIANFKPVSRDIAAELLDFVAAKNVGKSVVVDGEAYELVYISKNSSAFHKSRGLSVYFKSGKSIIRISDHWGSSEGYGKSRKLNCGLISGKDWRLVGKAEKVFCSTYAGRFPFEMLAGKCGLSALNKTCEHFSA